MASVTVRVVPRASRPGVAARPDGVVVRVRAAPEGGRATEEARLALAGALGIPKSRVSLRAGARSRIKVFEVRGLDDHDLEMRLRAT
ncbi:MAG: DUF167 domain-containing protein [Actinomycetota bacterium]